MQTLKLPPPGSNIADLSPNVVILQSQKKLTSHPQCIAQCCPSFLTTWATDFDLDPDFDLNLDFEFDPDFALDPDLDLDLDQVAIEVKGCASKLKSNY